MPGSDEDAHRGRGLTGDQPGGDAYVYALTDEAAYLHADDDEKPAISAEPMPDLLATRACSFCKRAAAHLFGEQYPRTDNTGAIIDGVWICDACVVRFAGFLAQERSGAQSPADLRPPASTPRASQDRSSRQITTRQARSSS